LDYKSLRCNASQRKKFGSAKDKEGWIEGLRKKNEEIKKIKNCDAVS